MAEVLGGTVVQQQTGGRNVIPRNRQVISKDTPPTQDSANLSEPHRGGLADATGSSFGIDDRRFSIERPSSNRKSKIDNRKFPGSFMIP